MRFQRHSLLRFLRSRCVVVFALLTALQGVGLAVGRDKALLVGSTNPGFLKEAVYGGKWITWDWPEIEGRIDFKSDAAFISMLAAVGP